MRGDLSRQRPTQAVKREEHRRPIARDYDLQACSDAHSTTGGKTHSKAYVIGVGTL